MAKIPRCGAALLVSVLGCSSHGGHATGDGGGTGGDAPSRGDSGGSNCPCDAGSGSSMHDAPSTATDAPVCNTTAGTCPAGQWCSETAPLGSGTILTAATMLDGDVFAAGGSGAIIRRHCGTWTAMTSGTTNNLSGAWATATSVWMVGDSGTVLRYDGTSWSPVDAGADTDDLAAVWASSDSDVWIVSSAAVSYYYNGTSWAKITAGLGGALLGVSGTAADDVWAVGETPDIHHYTTSWGPSPPLNPANAIDYFAVLELSPTNVWVSDDGTSETMNYDGSAWTGHSTSGNLIQAFWARAATDIYGVAGKQVGHWNGSAWSFAQPTGVTMPLYGITGAATDVFVVGGGATILHQD